MGIILAVLAAFFAALVVVFTKAGLKNLDSTLAFAVQGVFIFVITWAIVLAQSSAQQLGGQSRRTWLFLAGAGVCTTLATLCSFRALKLADATLVTPIERMSLVIVAILSVIFLKEKISWQVVTGIVLMIAGAVLVGVAKK